MYHSPNTTGSGGTPWLQQPGRNSFTQLRFLFSPCVEKEGNFTTVYLFLRCEVVFGMAIDLTYVVPHQGNSDNWAQDKSLTVIN